MSKSDIANQESGRVAGLSSVQVAPNGAQFSLTIQPRTDQAPLACSDVLNAWRRAHPEDFTSGNMFVESSNAKPK